MVGFEVVAGWAGEILRNRFVVVGDLAKVPPMIIDQEVGFKGHTIPTVINTCTYGICAKRKRGARFGGCSFVGVGQRSGDNLVAAKLLALKDRQLLKRTLIPRVEAPPLLVGSYTNAIDELAEKDAKNGGK